MMPDDLPSGESPNGGRSATVALLGLSREFSAGGSSTDS